MTKRLIPLTAKTDGFGPIIFRTKDNVYHFYQYYGSMPSMGDESHNLYFVDDIDIRKGDYFYSIRGLIEEAIIDYPKGEHLGKITATTNDELIRKGIPSIPEDYVRHFVYKNGDIKEVDIEVDNVYVEPPKGMHSNRGHFIEVPRIIYDNFNQKEVIIYQEPAPIVDWNKFTMDQFIEHLEDEFMFSSTGTAKAVTELIKSHKEMRDGLQWIKNEYTNNVNDQDGITDKINELLKTEK